MRAKCDKKGNAGGAVDCRRWKAKGVDAWSPEPKPVPLSPRHLALFEGFFVEGKGQSRALDVYDALPNFSLS